MPLLSFLNRKRQSLQASVSGSGGGEHDPPAAETPRGSGRRLTYAAGPTEQQQQQALAAAAATLRVVPNDTMETHTDGPGAISCDASSSGERQALAAPTVATGPRQQVVAVAVAGEGTAPEQEEKRSRRHSVRHDPFRLFRSRSTQFRPSGSGSEIGDAHGQEQARGRVSWPAPRSTTSTPVSEGQQGHAAQMQTTAPAHDRGVMMEGRRESERGPAALGEGTGARWGQTLPGRALDWVEAAPVAAGAVRDGDGDGGLHVDAADLQPRQDQTRRRSTIGTWTGISNSSIISSSSGHGSSNALQRLKRLPSLSFKVKRGFSRRKKVEMPSVMVTPATVVSRIPPFHLFLPIIMFRLVISFLLGLARGRRTRACQL